MSYQNFAAAAVFAVLLLIAGCPRDDGEELSDNRGYVTPPDRTATEASSLSAQNQPHLGGSAPYFEGDMPEILNIQGTVHASAKLAWQLVETSYFVVSDKWDESQELLQSEDPAVVKAGGQMREEVNTEIDDVIFMVNPEVERLFQEAIAEDPDNPNNHATYALYLQPRKRMLDGKPVQTEPEALEQIDRAIEMAPDRADYYMLKIQLMTSPHICHNWIRHYAEEEFIIAARLPEIRRMFTKAAALEPQNGYINLYKAILLSRLAPYVPGYNMALEGSGEPVEQPTTEELLREIRAGNDKEELKFFFPPPLEPHERVYRVPVLRAQTENAVYIDHWSQFGMHNMQDVDELATAVAKDLSWPEDRQDIGELVLMFYQLGRAQPYDRSFFGLQLKLLQSFAERSEPGSPEAMELSEALRYLSDQYQTLGNKLYDMSYIRDTKKVGVIGVHETELHNAHIRQLSETIQGHHKAYVHKLQDILGFDYTIYEQPKDW